MKYFLILGSVTALVSWGHPVVAKSPAEIEQIAMSVSVEMVTGVGSGVIIHREGDLYTAITNRHVVCDESGVNGGVIHLQRIAPPFTPSGTIFFLEVSCLIWHLL